MRCGLLLAIKFWQPLLLNCSGELAPEHYKSIVIIYISNGIIVHFRIWERETQWDAKVWNTPKSCVEAACWTPDSHTLIFASGGILYALHFVVNAVEKFINGDNSIVTPLFDISECHVPSEDDNLQFK